MSRSVTLVLAYIMTVTRLGWQEALAAVRVVRPCAGPNLGFQRQLQEFEAIQADQVRRSTRERESVWNIALHDIDYGAERLQRQYLVSIVIKNYIFLCYFPVVQRMATEGIQGQLLQ